MNLNLNKLDFNSIPIMDISCLQSLGSVSPAGEACCLSCRTCGSVQQRTWIKKTSTTASAHTGCFFLLGGGGLALVNLSFLQNRSVYQHES